MLRIFVTGDNHIGLKYASHKQSTVLASNRLTTFESMIQAANQESCDLFVITGDVEKAKRTYDEQKELLNHWLHIKEVFSEQKEGIRNNPMQDIADSFVRYLSIISAGRVSSEFPEANKLDMNIYSNDNLLDFRKLSEGTKETVSLAFRLAVLDHLFPEGGGIIVFDDPFTDMDAERAAQSCKLIKECAARHQVIRLLFFNDEHKHTSEKAAKQVLTMNERNKQNELALSTLKLARNTLLVNLRFLDMALSQFDFVHFDGSIAVDGSHIYYDPPWVLRRYKSEKQVIVRDYLHMVFHCVFHHAFVSTPEDIDAWDLACDIAVENAINELNLPCLSASRQAGQYILTEHLRQNVKQLTAEKIYRYLQDRAFTPDKIAKMRKSFAADDHSVWYAPPLLSISSSGDASDEYISSDDIKQTWSGIAQRMKTELEMFAEKRQGSESGSLVQSLSAVTREKYDYADFLRRFAVLGEIMKVNDDEFDYIFYTYGMKLYGNMPLIEPLEYKEAKRIKDFAVAIDTSGSVSGELVQKFVQKTYNILKQQENFFTKFNLHIIQCDAEIQEDVKITSQDEFDKYIETMQIRGLGGTDFRAVFEYVEQLRQNKEFVNLKGLIYFTDGFGTFPEKKPDYDTAFIFVDDEYSNPQVPPWAIKLVLQTDEI